MAELQFGKVRGQYLLIKGTTPRAATGRVTFTPIEPDEIVDGPKVTTREKTIAVFDANGWLHLDEVPVQYVQLAVGRWEVSFREAPGLTVKAFQFDVTPTGEEGFIDLPLLTPIVPTPAIKPVVNEFLYQQTILARDAAVEAQEAAEQAALDAVVPTQTVMDARIDARRGAAGGVASLGSDSKLPEAQVPDRLSPEGLLGTFVSLKAAAKNPDLLIVGGITRDANQAVTAADVVWPDGTPGTFTALKLSTAFPGAVDGYKITYGSPVTKTFTQPDITRNTAGAATTVPQIVVS